MNFHRKNRFDQSIKFREFVKAIIVSKYCYSNPNPFNSIELTFPPKLFHFSNSENYSNA